MCVSNHYIVYFKLIHDICQYLNKSEKEKKRNTEFHGTQITLCTLLDTYRMLHKYPLVGLLPSGFRNIIWSHPRAVSLLLFFSG